MQRVIILFFLSFLLWSDVFANDHLSDKRKLYIHHDIDELGEFNWGNFLTCLTYAKFPGDEGPRELNFATPRMVTTDISGHHWIISIREDLDQVIIESFTIDTHHSYTPKDKRAIFLRIIGNCKLN